MTDEFFLAIAGQRRDLQRRADRGDRAALRSAGSRIAGPRKLVDRLSVAEPSFSVIPRVRSLALRLAHVATGDCDIAIAGPDSHDWDLAAADLLVHEAGGVRCTVSGAAASSIIALCRGTGH